MFEPMNVKVEVWPVAADESGLWLVSGDEPWASSPVLSDGDVHYEVEFLLRGHGIHAEDVTALHSTSWRPDGPSIVLTYMAAVAPGGLARDRWPNAAPITVTLADAVGKPPTHAADEAPIPRMIDVLLHGLRHLAYLADHDTPAAEAMGELWRRHLDPLRPALAGMYSESHWAA